MRSRRPAGHRRRLGRAFNRLWVGFAFSSSGDGIAAGAVPLLAVTVNPNPFAVSTVVAADSLPWLLMALPAGAFADRFERGPVAALSNSLRALVIILAALLILSDRMTLTLLILIVLVNASARAFFYSSYQALVPELVDSRDLEHANGFLSATESGTEYLGGPIVGTTLFAVAQVPARSSPTRSPWWLRAFPLLRFRTKAAQAGSSTSMWEGVRLLFADNRLRVLLLLIASLAGLQGMESGVLVLLATKVWGIPEGAYGLFLATGAAGALVGSFLADGVSRRIGGGTRADRGGGRLGLRLSRHGGCNELGGGCAGLRARGSGGRRRIRRGHVTAPTADAEGSHGSRRRCLARNRLGCSASRCTRRRGHRRGVGHPLAASWSPGSCSVSSPSFSLGHSSRGSNTFGDRAAWPRAVGSSAESSPP